MMSLGFLLMGTFFFIFSFSGSFLLASCLLLLMGIGVGCSQVSAAKAVMDWFPFKGRATAMGVKQTGINVGGVLSSSLVPFLITLSGVFLMAVQFSFSAYAVLYLNQTLHYSIEQAGVFLALSFGTGAFARVGWSLGSDYFFRNRESVLS